MESLFQDIRYGGRILLRQPVFATTVILTLALAIGANTAIFSVASAVLLRPYAHIETDRWAYVWEKPNIEGLSQVSVSTQNYLDWKQQSNSFSDMVLWQPWGYNISESGAGDPERVRAAVVTSDLFQAMGLAPAAGRLLQPDDAKNSERLVVISYGLWQRRFAGDPDLPGKKIELNLVPHTVVGVAPKDFSFPVEFQVDIWTLFPDSALQAGKRDGRGYRVAGKLAPAASFKSAQTELNLITERLADAYPEDNGFGAMVIPMRESVAGSFRAPLLALMGALGLVLLLACVNIGNLQLVRLESRRKELALRTALGAGRGRLIRQLITESLMLVFIAGTAGVLLAPTLVRLLLSLIPPDQAPWLAVKTDPMALLATAGVTALAVVLAGVLPAIKSSRFELTHALSAGGAVTGSAGINRGLRRALLVAQLAMALVPLAGTGLLVQTFLRLAHVDPGFKTDRRLTLSFSAPNARYAGAEKVQILAERVAEQTRQVPSVRDAGLVQFLPFSSAPGWLQALSREDPKGIQNPADLPHVRYMVASTGYLEAMGIPLKSGRTIAKADSKEAMPVVIINESLAKKYFPDEDPVGKQIWVGHAQLLASLAPRTIVGVAGDHVIRGLGAPPEPAVWIPISQQGFFDSIWRNLYLVVHADSEPKGILASVRERMAGIDPQLALTDVATMEERLGNSLWQQRLMAFVVSGLGLSAAAIAVLGVFGITSYTVSRRVREIGVRMALGAEARDISRLVLIEGFWLALIGVALGTVGALGLTRFIASLLYGVGAADPLTFAGVATLLAALALVACYIPARRATKVDPLVALRYE
jgi:predicted permease